MDEERFAALEARVRNTEDQLEIIRLVASYGPAVDSGQSRKAGELWAKDGVYDPGGLEPMIGPDGVAATMDGPIHRKLIRKGAGHILSTPQITHLEGDEAWALNHAFVLLKGDDGWDVWRATANAWKLRRTADGWRVEYRLNRVLDGSEESHDTFRKGVR